MIFAAVLIIEFIIIIIIIGGGGGGGRLCNHSRTVWLPDQYSNQVNT